MAPRRRRAALFAIKLAVTLGLLAWLVHQILAKEGIDALVHRLSVLRWEWIAAAVALHLTAVLAGVVRWHTLLRAGEIDLPLPWLLRSFLVGRFVGAFTPSTAGLDGWRVYEVSRQTGRTAQSAAVIAVEKLVGLLGMAAVCGALVPFGARRLLGDGAIVSTVSIAAGASIVLLALGRPSWMRRLAARLPFARSRALSVAEALERTRPTPGALARALALGAVSHLALSAVFLATARALGVDASAGTMLVTGNAIVVAVLLPISIGGVGVREGVAVMLLASAGVAPADAMLVALLGYVTGQVPALAGGLLLVAKRAAASSVHSPAEPSLAEPALAPAEQTG
ncbi:MAG: flippase-like domain-containing protein [Sandaracinaceae bacterium]|nr:flippase-like domain-containing protein [Sandaracinaceae bacterium]